VEPSPERYYKILRPFTEGEPQADSTAVERAIADHLGTIDHIRRGARLGNGQYPYEWEKGLDGKQPRVHGSRAVALIAAAQAKLWADAGRGPEAIDLLLELCVFANDVGRNGPVLAYVTGDDIHGIALNQIRQLIIDGRLSRQDLLRLSPNLALLDHGLFRFAPALANETLAYGWVMFNLKQTENESALPAPLRFWKAPEYAILLQSLDQLQAYTEQFKDIDVMPFTEVASKGAAAEKQTEASSNPSFRLVFPTVAGPAARRRETLTQIRMLRMASEFVATGDITALDDPFTGAQLSNRLAGNTLTIWSHGREGKDHGGQGEWGYRPGKDLELKVKR
jgi:hypothetical protein